MKKKQLIAFASAMALAVTSLAGCGKSEESTQKEAVSEAEGTAKEDLPLSKYPETVTVHLGGSLNPNAKLPDGMAYDDNPYIDFLKEDLNIEVVYDWVASSTDFEEKMNLCIGSNTVPELMNVNATQYRALLKYDMIQPLDKYFDDYASDALKSYVKSGGEELQKCITNEDGELMAIPAPAITAGGINEMWIRQDWLDSLGLEAPRTWDELVKVAEAFVTQDPDGNGEDDTIGILGPSNSDHMNAIGGNQYGLDPLFSSFQSYPQYWLQGEDGTVEYGSIQPETRDALEKISELYTNKLIDPEMLVRSDSKEPLLAGKVGIFFGPWWCGYTVADATLAGAADWQAYFTPLSEDGNYYAHMAEPTTQYVVASKACKNPEAAFKIVNYLIKNEQKWVDEGVSTTEMGTADFYPLYNTYDNADEIEVSYDVLTKYLAGEITMDDVDFSTHKLLKSDMEAVTKLKKEPYDDFSLDKWNLDSDIAKNNLPRLVSILVGDAPSVNDKYVPVYNAYNGQTETMGAKAITDLVYGITNPSGKLAVSIPWCVGQVPISYWDIKTGHVLTADNLENRFTSRYMDIPNTPLYPFGFGLSYTEFDVSDVEIKTEQDKRVHVHCKVSNTGNVAGAEVVQCYYETLHASVVRPKKELVRFQKVFLDPGEKKNVDFYIDPKEFSYYDKNMEIVSSGMQLRISAGNSSDHEWGSSEIDI